MKIAVLISGTGTNMMAIINAINAGELDFATAAESYSKDTASAAEGGNVGWDRLSNLVTEYTTALPDDQPEVYQTALTGTGCTAVTVTVDNSGFDEGDFEFDAATGTITEARGVISEDTE